MKLKHWILVLSITMIFAFAYWNFPFQLKQTHGMILDAKMRFPNSREESQTNSLPELTLVEFYAGY